MAQERTGKLCDFWLLACVNLKLITYSKPIAVCSTDKVFLDKLNAR